MKFSLLSMVFGLAFSASALTLTPVQQDGYGLQALMIPPNELNQFCAGPVKDAAVRCVIPKALLGTLPGKFIDAQIAEVTSRSGSLRFPETIAFQSSFDAIEIIIDGDATEPVRSAIAKQFQDGDLRVQLVYAGPPL